MTAEFRRFESVYPSFSLKNRNHDFNNKKEEQIMFTENELKMIQFALSRLHDADLSGLKKENLEALESAMNKFNIKFVSSVDSYYMEDGSKQY